MKSIYFDQSKSGFTGPDGIEYFHNFWWKEVQKTSTHYLSH